jgi:hypothetical protein
VSQSEVSAFVGKYFIPRHQILTISHTRPVSMTVSYAVALAVFLLMFQISKTLFIRPADMTRIRYVAKFRWFNFYGFFWAAVSGILLIAVLRLMLYGYNLADTYIFEDVDNFWFRSYMQALMFVIAVSVGISVLMCIPYKLLIFDDHVRIKYLFYRSRIIRPEGIESIASARFAEVWLSRKLWKCVPLTTGFFYPGIYLKLRNGWSYFFRARNNGELMTMLGRLVESKQ